MAKIRIPAAEVMGDAFSALWREKRLALLLATFLAVLMLIWFWPFLGPYFNFISAIFSGRVVNQDVFLEEIYTYLGYFLVLLIPMLIIQIAIYVLWSRATILGANAAMEGGFRVLVNRTLWALWRFICAIGWMIVLMAVFFVVILGIAFLAGAPLSLSDSSSGANALTGIMLLVIFPLYAAFFLAILALYVLIGISIHGEARDMRFPVHKAYQLMRGNLLRAAGLFLLVTLLFEIGITPIFFIVLPTDPSTVPLSTTVALFLVFLTSTLYYFLWFSYGAEYAKRLVHGFNRENIYS